MVSEQEARTLTIQYQQLQQQLQAVMMQKENTKMQEMEIDAALKELAKSKDDVYKSTGLLLIKAEPEKIKTELGERKNMLEVRLKSLEKQEDTVKKKISELYAKLTQGVAQ